MKREVKFILRFSALSKMREKCHKMKNLLSND
jgi:hypothetical protein